MLVEVWATRHDDGTVDVLLWNGSVNAELMHGDPRLERRVTVTVEGLARVAVHRLARPRRRRSTRTSWPDTPTDVDWPDAELWQRLPSR